MNTMLFLVGKHLYSNRRLLVTFTILLLVSLLLLQANQKGLRTTHQDSTITTEQTKLTDIIKKVTKTDDIQARSLREVLSISREILTILKTQNASQSGTGNARRDQTEDTYKPKKSQKTPGGLMNMSTLKKVPALNIGKHVPINVQEKIKRGEQMGTKSLFEPYCSMFSNSFKYLIWPEVPSDFSDWTYQRRRICPEFVVPNNNTNTLRVKYSLTCSHNKPKLIPSYTKKSDDIQRVKLGDPCLAKFTNSCCMDANGIPNIVHYVWYFKNEMNFYMFVSMLSVIRYVRPCLILFHGEYVPYGKYWDYLVRIYPNVLHVFTVRPEYVFGNKLAYHEHSGDIMRIKALMRLGGMYFDTDIILLRDLEPLRKHNFTLCLQKTGYLLNAFIMAKKNATFLTLWLDGYRKDYHSKGNDSYVYNSMFYSKDLAQNRTDLVHIEEGTLCSPLELIGKPVNSSMAYDWSELYGYHLYARTIQFPLSEVWIKHFNSTVGAMMRHIIYGNKELCDGPVHTFN